MDSHLHLMQQQSLFRHLELEQFLALRPFITLESVPAKIEIIRAGYPNDTLWVATSGSVKVWVPRSNGGEVVLGLYGADEVLGEMSVIERLPASASVRTLERSMMLRIEGDAFRHVLATSEKLAANVNYIQTTRLRRWTNRAEIMMINNLSSRVARQLLLFAQDYGVQAFPRPGHGSPEHCGFAGAQRGPEYVLLPLPLKQQDLANLVGASREKVNHVLSDFQSRGYLSIGRRYLYTLHDFEALRQLSA